MDGVFEQLGVHVQRSLKVRRVFAAAGILLVGATLPAFAAPSNTYTVVVDQDSFDGSGLGQGDWNVTTDPSRKAGQAELVAGPLAPPKGSGSLRLSTIGADEQTTVTGKGFDDLKLASLTELSYSTFVDPDSNPGVADISVKIGLSDTTLVFEPYMGYGNALAGQRGAWRSWDTVNAPAAGWWTTRNYTTCTQAAPCSFSDIKALVDPNNTKFLVDMKLAIGSGIANFDGNVDALTAVFNDFEVIFDFESNAAGDDTVTRVDDATPRGWTFEGTNATSSFVAGPGFAGQSGLGSAALEHSGAGGFSSIVQSYFEGQGDVTQAYLGDLDNIELKTYRLSASTKGDYPSMRFEVRVPDPTTQFAFTSIVNMPTPMTNDAIDTVNAIRPANGTADTASWWLTRPVAGLEAQTAYTWAQLMRTDLADAVILKALVAAGSSTGLGEFKGGVDTLRFDFRDGSSQLWDFEKGGLYPTTTTTAAPTTTTEAPTTTSSTIAPTTTTTAPAGALPYVKITTPNLSIMPDGVTIEGTVRDPDSAVASVGVVFRPRIGSSYGQFAVCTGCEVADNAGTWTLEVPEGKLLPGTYELRAYGADVNGNVGMSDPITIVVGMS